MAPEKGVLKRKRNRRKKTSRAAAKVLQGQEEQTSDPGMDWEGGSSSKATVITTDMEDDELVFVCRATAPDFCTYFVPTIQCPTNKCDTTMKDWRPFTLHVPSYRDTCEGYTLYQIVIGICHDRTKQFKLERRFSEFVTFAAVLDEQTRLDCVNSESAIRGLRSELPPKTWFRMTNEYDLDERRGKLERWMEIVLQLEDGRVCRLPVIRDFLMLDLFGAQIMEEKLQQHLD